MPMVGRCHDYGIDVRILQKPPMVLVFPHRAAGERRSFVKPDAVNVTKSYPFDADPVAGLHELPPRRNGADHAKPRAVAGSKNAVVRGGCLYSRLS
jgi:hypothetical protein